VKWKVLYISKYFARIIPQKHEDVKGFFPRSGRRHASLGFVEAGRPSWRDRRPLEKSRVEEAEVVWPYPEVVDGHARALEGPGLGIEANEALVDEALAASKPFVPSLQVPRLRGPVEWAEQIGAGFLRQEERCKNRARVSQQSFLCPPRASHISTSTWRTWHDEIANLGRSVVE
jgi:hypothetical protein